MSSFLDNLESAGSSTSRPASLSKNVRIVPNGLLEQQRALNPVTKSPSATASCARRMLQPPVEPCGLKIPLGDGPYVRAKQVQLLERDPDRAIAMFWASINAADRIDSALKDMAILMKQQNRPEEAIQAIRSFRDKCSDQAQESLDNILLDLYKKCGRLDEHIDLLMHKLNLIRKGIAFNGKSTKTARSHGRKFQISVSQEAARLLGNLGWTYMQKSNYIAAEAAYRKALSIESDNNKLFNLGVCLLRQGKPEEARIVLQSTSDNLERPLNANSNLKSYERSQRLLEELDVGCKIEMSSVVSSISSSVQEYDLWSHSTFWEPPSERTQHSGSETSDSSEGGEVDEAGDKWNPGNHFHKTEFRREIGPLHKQTMNVSFQENHPRLEADNWDSTLSREINFEGKTETDVLSGLVEPCYSSSYASMNFGDEGQSECNWISDSRKCFRFPSSYHVSDCIDEGSFVVKRTEEIDSLDESEEIDFTLCGHSR